MCVGINLYVRHYEIGMTSDLTSISITSRPMRHLQKLRSLTRLNQDSKILEKRRRLRSTVHDDDDEMEAESDVKLVPSLLYYYY